jgi:hypothetical protein
VLRLTADQLEDLGRRVWKLLATYEAGHPVEGAREVVVLFAAYPRP